MNESPLGADADPLLRALRSAATAGPGAAGRPGQIRSRLEAELGPEDAMRFRGPVHQLVAAAEEHLPGTLSGLAPLTPGSLERVASDLAQSRGWSYETAHRTTTLWATALGLVDAVSAGLGTTPSIPPRPAPGGSAEPLASPSPAPVPVVSPMAAVEPPTVLPAAAISPPTPSAEPAASPEPAAWPKSPRRLTRLKAPEDGLPVIAYGQGYAGIHLAAYLAGIATLLFVLVGAVIVLVPEGSAGGPPVFGMLLGGAAALGLGTLLKPGLLIATDRGLEFTQLDPRMTKPKLDTTVSAAWSEVRISVGTFSCVNLGGRSIQLGPRSGALARAIAAQAGA